MTKQEFWQYFEEHMSALEQLISSNVHDYTIYNEISDKLRQYDEHLIPEITMDGQGRFVLVLSCDGDREGMPALEHLAENYEAGAVLHLDHTIGEYNSMTLVEEIEFKRIGCFEKISGLKILDDLRDEIDALKQPS